MTKVSAIIPAYNDTILSSINLNSSDVALVLNDEYTISTVLYLTLPDTRLDSISDHSDS